MPRLIRDKAGMTVMEIMIVVLIIALLAAIALPAFLRSRHRVQETRFVSDMRIASSAFQQRAFISLPPDAAPGIVPASMADYLTRMAWDEPTPIEGQWDWEPGAAVGAGIRVVGITIDTERMERIDATLDDGDLTVGLFQQLDPTTYIYIIQ